MQKRAVGFSRFAHRWQVVVTVTASSQAQRSIPSTRSGEPVPTPRDTISAPERTRPTAEPSVRAGYEKHGAENYYRRFGRDYRNPHEPAVRASLRVATQTWPLDLTHVLDLAAGSGEATLGLIELGAARVDATDPYTHEAYESRVGRPAERLGFADVAAGALAGRRYSLVVCSFALHLCETSRLPAVAYQMSLIAPHLLVLTPHKRPEIRPVWGWLPSGERVVERVRTRWYRSVSREQSHLPG